MADSILYHIPTEISNENHENPLPTCRINETSRLEQIKRRTDWKSGLGMMYFGRKKSPCLTYITAK